MGKTNNNTTITEIVAYNLITIYKEDDGCGAARWFCKRL